MNHFAVEERCGLTTNLGSFRSTALPNSREHDECRDIHKELEYNNGQAHEQLARWRLDTPRLVEGHPLRFNPMSTNNSRVKW